jgi:serine protease AprX
MGMSTSSGQSALGASWIRRRALAVPAVLVGLVAAGAVMGPAAEAAPAPAGPSSTYVVRADTGHIAGVVKALHARHVKVTSTLRSLDSAIVSMPAASAAAVGYLPYVAEVTKDATLGAQSDAYNQVTDAGSAYNIARSLNVDDSWTRGSRGGGTSVALIDTGVSPVGSLQSSTWVTNGPDLSFDSQSSNTRYLDLNGHGTFMAGLIAARPGGNSDNYQGMAPDTHLINIKVGDAIGRADVSQVIAGIDWAVEHQSDLKIRVINLSFGTDTTQSYLLDPLAHAAEVAWRKGIVVVASAGNGGGTKLSMPAADPFVIAVGALDGKGTVTTSDDVLASFSAQGNWRRPVDLVVPGVKVQGLRVPGSYISDQLGSGGGISSSYLRGSGTSEAAAIVSGIVADLISARPNLTPNQVKELLTSTGDDVANTQGVIPDLQAAEAAPAPSNCSAGQWYQRSTGLGSLESSRGSYHVSDGNNNTLTGEQDIFGNDVDMSVLAASEEATNAWVGGVWNGASWAGASWAGASWASVTWAGASWAGASWAGASWAGASWAGASWTGAGWAGAGWAGAGWAGAGWAGAGWASEDYS